MKKIYIVPTVKIVKLMSEKIMGLQSKMSINNNDSDEKVESVDELLSRQSSFGQWDDE